MSPYRLFMVVGDYSGGRNTLFYRDRQEAKRVAEGMRRDESYTNVQVFLADTAWKVVTP